MVVRLGVVLGVLASLAEAARAMALLGTTEAMNLGEGASSGLGLWAVPAIPSASRCCDVGANRETGDRDSPGGCLIFPGP